MPFVVRISGRSEIVAGIDGSGSIGVHLVDYPGGKTPTTVRVRAFRNVAKHETESLEWGQIELSPGDAVTIEYVESASASPPIQRRSSRDDERICVNDRETAQAVRDLVAPFCDQLFALVPRVEATGTAEDLRKFKMAVGRVSYEAYEQVLVPIYNRHAQLAPENPREE